jgi:hypothetical protein
MKSMIAVLLLILGFNQAWAQKKPLACLTEKGAGLKWDKGSWKATEFKDAKFLMFMDGESLSVDSAKTINAGTYDQCSVGLKGRVYCFDDLGGYLIYDPETGKGSLALTLGGTSSDQKRDDVAVYVFNCSSF